MIGHPGRHAVRGQAYTDAECMMFQDHDTSTDFTGGATPPHEAARESATGEPRIRAKLHEPIEWKQLFRDALRLTLDTLDDAGDRMGRELGLRNQQPKPDDVA